VIVVDASTLVSATFRQGSVPDLAVRHALLTGRVVMSEPVMAEFLDVLYRPGLAQYIKPELRADLLGQFRAGTAVVVPTVRVTDCRDAKDNKYLELAIAANATTIVSSDGDLLVLHPWRGVRILLPTAYLAEVEGR
jgi:putative PIN family toxin of toxin-antitoxin system